MTSIENPVLFFILLGMNVPIFLIVGRRLFGNSRTWKASLLDAFRPDSVVPFRGFKASWPGEKVWLFFVGCFVVVAIEYAVLSALVARLFMGTE